MNRKIRVIVVDDSAVIRSLLTEILSSDPQIDVVAAAVDPYIARRKIKELNPDVITLDVEMPRMDGISFLERLMRLRPMPVVMISSLTQKGARTTLKALELGAVDFIPKPRVGKASELANYSEEIIAKVKNAASVDVSTMAPRRLSRRAPDNAPRIEVTPSFSATVVLEKPLPGKAPRSRQMVIAIGASTGGTEAVREVILGLPLDSPPILVAQHIPPVFSASFAERLNEISALTVGEAQDGQEVLPGHVYVAPGDRHLLLDGNSRRLYCKLSDRAPVNRHRPSVDVLFRSVAAIAGANAIGVILTGMGADGAQGIGELLEVGARTLAQDKESSVVWGMPGEAVKRGAIEEVLSLYKISEKIQQLVNAETARQR
jgi:two-component system chemotaxis response regulator CheB